MKDNVERRATGLYDDLLLPEETRAIRHRVREVADELLRPCAHALNTQPEAVEAFPWDLMKRFADAGLIDADFAGRAQPGQRLADGKSPYGTISQLRSIL